MLYIVRHGQTLWNRQKKPQGHSDSPLTLKGIEQAKHIAKILGKEEGGFDNFEFVVSPLGRTKQFAHIIMETLGVDKDMTMEPMAKEIALGIWEGISSDMHPIVLKEEYEARKLDEWNYLHPGGESSAMFFERVRGLWDKYKQKENTVLVTHNGVSIHFRSLAKGITNASFLDKSLDHKQDTVYRIWNNKIEELKI